MTEISSFILFGSGPVLSGLWTLVIKGTTIKQDKTKENMWAFYCGNVNFYGRIRPKETTSLLWNCGVGKRLQVMGCFWKYLDLILFSIITFLIKPRESSIKFIIWQIHCQGKLLGGSLRLQTILSTCALVTRDFWNKGLQAERLTPSEFLNELF